VGVKEVEILVVGQFEEANIKILSLCPWFTDNFFYLKFKKSASICGLNNYGRVRSSITASNGYDFFICPPTKNI
jgi:hypothetical protein